MRLKPSTGETLVFAVYARSREKVVSGLHAARSYTWKQVQQSANAKTQQSLEEMTLKSASKSVNGAVRRSYLVLDLLTNRNTGGIIAGPDVQSGIESAPGYGAV
jgi:glucoamylase